MKKQTLPNMKAVVDFMRKHGVTIQLELDEDQLHVYVVSAHEDAPILLDDGDLDVPWTGLKTEDPDNADEALVAFWDSDEATNREGHNITTAFEHGQLWIHDNDTGANWSVIDEEPGINGYGFERISQGDED